jgi:diacylglycerol kinase (ATP)
MRVWLLGLARSFGWAFAGVWHMLRRQRNAQIHSLITILVIVFGVVLQVNAAEWVALVLAIALVLALEALNTALEAVVDLASPQIHPLAKHAKDTAAGAVLIGAIGAAIAGCIIFLPKLWTLVRSWL